MLEAAPGKSDTAFFASTVFSLVVLCEIFLYMFHLPLKIAR